MSDVLRPGESRVFRFPIPGDWGGGVQVRLQATCGRCGGNMIPGRAKHTLVCENSHWFNRKRHAYCTIEASVVRVERGWP